MTTTELQINNTQIFIAYVFTLNNSVETGNGAGVIIDLENKLSDKEMQKIAAELGFSESAFIKPSSKSTYKVLFYTPTNRVAMCGHATVAAWGILYKNGYIKAGDFSQEIIDLNNSSTVLNIEISENGDVFTSLSLPIFKAEVEFSEVNNLLPINAMHSQLKPQIVNTGFDDLLVPIEELNTFEKIKYEDFLQEELIRVQNKFHAEGIHSFYINKSDNGLIILCKNTDPNNGIYPYDNATGTTNGALVSYLFKNKIITKEELAEGIAIKQFGIDNRQSLLMVKGFVDNQNEIATLKVGGQVAS